MRAAAQTMIPASVGAPARLRRAKIRVIERATRRACSALVFFRGLAHRPLSFGSHWIFLLYSHGANAYEIRSQQIILLEQARAEAWSVVRIRGGFLTPSSLETPGSRRMVPAGSTGFITSLNTGVVEGGTPSPRGETMDQSARTSSRPHSPDGRARAALQ